MMRQSSHSNLNDHEREQASYFRNYGRPNNKCDAYGEREFVSLV